MTVYNPIFENEAERTAKLTTLQKDIKSRARRVLFKRVFRIMIANKLSKKQKSNVTTLVPKHNDGRKLINVA